MEKKILKLKISNVPDPRNALPSERRYSASLVLGFSVMFLVLFILSSTVGGIIIHKIIEHDKTVTEQSTGASNDTTAMHHDRQLGLRILRDMHPYNVHYEINMPSLICAGCFIMALGHLLSSVAGFLAWKHWFIDNNITYFCLFTWFSIFTSVICLLLNLVMVLYATPYDRENLYPPIGRALVVFLLVLSIVSIAWTAMAAKIAFRGMKNRYPDGGVTSTNVSAVNTICRQNMNENVVPSQLFNQCLYTSDGKVRKYLEEDGKNGLSGEEYERVQQFVREHSDKQEARC